MMELDAPVYRVVVDYEDETGILRNSMVKYPAVEVEKLCFDNKPTKLDFSSSSSDQKFISVSMKADTPIERKTKSGEKYYVVFTKEDIDIIVNKFSKEMKFHEMDWQHDSDEMVGGIYMTGHFKTRNGLIECPAFDVPEGSWITEYWVEDKDQYEAFANDPDFNGFSIEIEARLEEMVYSKFADEFRQVEDAITIVYNKIKKVLNDDRVSDTGKYNRIKNLLDTLN